VNVSNPVLPLPPDPNEPPPQQTIFGGALPDELDFLSFSQMAKARSWVVTPSLEDIQAVMRRGSTKSALVSALEKTIDRRKSLRRPWRGAILRDASWNSTRAGSFFCASMPLSPPQKAKRFNQ
jgi:hypothetical protein